MSTIQVNTPIMQMPKSLSRGFLQEKTVTLSDDGWLVLFIF